MQTANRPPPDQNLLPLDVVAAEYNLSERRLRKAASRGFLKTLKAGRARFARRPDVEVWIEAGAPDGEPQKHGGSNGY
jgi:hypothetical protein